jgi:HprK-related kinase B
MLSEGIEMASSETKTFVTRSIAALSRELDRQYSPQHELCIEFGGWVVQVRSNSAPLLESLRDYFGDLAQPPLDGSRHSRVVDVVIRAFEAPAPDFGCAFRDLEREAGKTVKVQFFDLADGRVVHKVKTGMQFLLGAEDLVAVGPCLANTNQIVNFINSQFISQRLHEGWALCHAAGVAHSSWSGGAAGGRGVGIASRAGAGKSTLAFHLMSSGLSFVSNDRLLIKNTAGEAEMAGIPKIPRVNPGTLLNNPDLQGILPAERQRQLAQLPREQLWDLQEKYRVLIDQVYGRGRTVYRVTLAGLLILNWSWSDSSAPTRFHSVDLAERRDLLELVMKSPGVYHRDRAGRSAAETSRPEPAAYLEAVRHTRVWEATGCPQFDLGVSFCRRLLEV